jgi:polyhydroxybutyrate depolymerase
MNHTLAKLILTIAFIGQLSGFACVASAVETSTAVRPSASGKTLIHDGLSRTYTVHLPDSSLRKGKVPLVLVLHGGGGNADNAERMTGFSAMADKEGFIVVYPEGSGRRNGRFLTWNAGHCCGYAMANRVDDVGFVRVLIDTLIKDYPIDAKRVYVTGMSNGGMMAHRLGRELPDRIAAIAPVVATLFGDEGRPTEPVSAIMFNGQLDASVPPTGGAPGGRFAGAWDGRPARPALDQLVFWARANGCSNDAADDATGHDRGDYVLWQAQCPTGLATELYLIKNTGHAWPGGQRGTFRANDPGTSVRATDIIWAFFKTHEKR